MTSLTPSNPFDITKASDFTDEQIMNYWVEAFGQSSLVEMAKPLSQMPMIILGGKGSGKTHLMRYFSYAIQKLRNLDKPLSGVLSDGYIGIYQRCSSLNAMRFHAKGFGDDVWGPVFAYSMELWLSDIVLRTIQDLYSQDPELKQHEAAVCTGVLQLFDADFSPPPATVSDLLELLEQQQAQISRAINNSFKTKSLDLTILASPGKLVFGIPKVLTSILPSLKSIRFLYLLDEFENLPLLHQRYINALLREREEPCSIKVGSRLYGIKTFRTLTDEENLEGGEFEFLRLDEDLRRRPDDYLQFSVKLVLNRLGRNATDGLGYLRACFETCDSHNFYEKEVSSIAAKYRSDEPPYLSRLRKELKANSRLLSLDDGGIDSVIANLRCPNFPMLEKLNVFLLYRAWSRKRNLVLESLSIAESCRDTLAGERGSEYIGFYQKWHPDLFAQLLRDCELKQQYSGFDSFVHMSQGIPRGLLTILKNVYDWSVFRGEAPFAGKPISKDAQADGITEASNWFFNDARGPGGRGAEIRSAVTRLATLFREIRFADKPSEKSLSSFSADTQSATARTREVIELAKQWSLVIYVGEQRNKNTLRMDQKYQLNSMVAPRWDLPIYRGGSLDISADELNAIFDPAFSEEFDSALKIRSSRLNVPFAARRVGSKDHPDGALADEQLGGLFEDSDE